MSNARFKIGDKIQVIKKRKGYTFLVCEKHAGEKGIVITIDENCEEYRKMQSVLIEFKDSSMCWYKIDEVKHV